MTLFGLVQLTFNPPADIYLMGRFLYVGIESECAEICTVGTKHGNRVRININESIFKENDC